MSPAVVALSPQLAIVGGARGASTWGAPFWGLAFGTLLLTALSVKSGTFYLPLGRVERRTQALKFWLSAGVLSAVGAVLCGVALWIDFHSRLSLPAP